MKIYPYLEAEKMVYVNTLKPMKILSRSLISLLLILLPAFSNPPASEWQLITPDGAGQATGSNFEPLERAFNGNPTWDTATESVTGPGGVVELFAYADRHGYIDFGANYDQLHIMETWTLYRAFSSGTQLGYVEMWWDDDIDNVNDNGVIETRLNFNSVSNLPNSSSELWARDVRVNELGGVIPKRRYLVMQFSSPVTYRAIEYAIIGYVYDGLVPPEYADTLFLNMDTNTVAENQTARQRLGTLQLTGGKAGETYTLEFNHNEGDNAAFTFENGELWSRQSFNYESQHSYSVEFDAVAGSDGTRESVTALVKITDVTGPFDTNGPASAAVAAAYEQINEGDFVIWNATGANSHLYYNSDTFSVSYPNKVLIKGGFYEVMNLNLNWISGGSPTMRVPITNFLGQVYSNRISLWNGSFWRFTGEYDEQLGTGDPAYTGCQVEGGSNFAYSTGNYGIWASNEWSDYHNIITIGGTATGWEVDNLEVCDGGFAGFAIKNDNSNVNMNDVHLHHLYIHDIGSEGIYLGYFDQTLNNQHQFERIVVENIASLRTGTEALQLGQLSEGSIIRNNVAWGAMEWLEPFQFYHDNTFQMGVRQGDVTVRDNIILGGAEKSCNFASYGKDTITPNGQPIRMLNNLMWGTRGGFSVWIFPNSSEDIDWVWEDNVFGGYNFGYDRVAATAQDTNYVVAVPINSTASVNAKDNLTDLTRTNVLEKLWGGSTIAEQGTQAVALEAPNFVNLLGPGQAFDVQDWSKYAEYIGVSAGHPNRSPRGGEEVFYDVGEIVQHPVNGKTRFYRCLISHSLQVPPENGNQYWELLKWVRPDGAFQYSPPDDVRLAEDSFYHQRGMGIGDSALIDLSQFFSYEGWLVHHGITDPVGEAGAHLLHYVLNTTITENLANITPRLELTSNGYQYQLNRLTTSTLDVNQVLQYSTDLQTWDGEVKLSDPNLPIGVTVNEESDGMEEVTIALDENLEVAGKLFVRLLVEKK